MTADDLLVWCDLETTGLDRTGADVPLEIAVLVTDLDLCVLGDGFERVLWVPDSTLWRMVPEVQEMHGASGLTAEVRVSTLNCTEVALDALNYVRGFDLDAPPKTLPLCGNTVGFDRDFLRRYMLRFEEHFHYRSIDVSAVKELCRRWYPEAFAQAPAKRLAHRAMPDLLESIEELRYYRQSIFLPVAAEMRL